MKKYLRISLFLVIAVTADQLIKLVIAHYFANASADLIPGILRFSPVQNINLTWIASIMNYDAPVGLVLFIQLLAAAFILLMHRYLSYLWNGNQYLLNAMLVCYIAGIFCAFIDVVFWGGSLDYIGIFDWFIFDMKDVYFAVGTIHVLLYTGVYTFRIYLKLSKEERRQTGVWHWIKKGLPAHN